MLYQSFSGDAEVGTSIFSMDGGSLTVAVGPLFYITNTDSIIELKGVDLTTISGTLLTASADRLGNSGSNGGVVTFGQRMKFLTAISPVTASVRLQLYFRIVLP